MNPISFLRLMLGIITLAFLGVWARSAFFLREQTQAVRTSLFPTPRLIFIGLITDFFDTLGIGSYAPTTSLFKFTKLVDDRVIPGTMTIGHFLPTVLETLIYLTIVPVEPVTLFSMLGASMLGAWLGAGVVAKLSKRAVQIGMGLALCFAVVLLFCKQMEFFPAGGEALGVTGTKLLIGVSTNFVLGALMTIGIGMFAPCMIIVYLLGMSPKAAFPIMMGSCAFLMPVGAIPFLREKSYDNRAALGLSLGGIPGVLLAAYLFYQLSVRWVLWLVIGVSALTAVSLLRSAQISDRQ
jgi:uncharacterized membrane protein YfcA